MKRRLLITIIVCVIVLAAAAAYSGFWNSRQYSGAIRVGFV